MKKHVIVFILMLVILTGFLDQIFAGAWEVNKKHWPRLIFETADIPVVKAHYDAALQGKEPYKTLLERIQATAAKTPSATDKAWAQQMVNGNIGKSKALIFLLTGNQSYGDEAKNILLKMFPGDEVPKYSVTSFSFNTSAYKNLKSSVMQSIHAAQSLTLHCQVYDLLKGAGYNFGASETKIRENISTLADRIYNISSWISSGAKVANLLVEDVEEQNNFQLKMMSALGLAAITLNESGLADKWINRAMSKFWQVYKAQTTSIGGYGEGPFYFMYSSLNFLPFFRAYNLFMDGKGGTFEGYQVPNFLSDARVAKVFDWYVKIRMPNGDRPGYDDGYYAPYPIGALVNDSRLSNHATDHFPSSNLGVYVWDWENTEKMSDGYDNRYFSGFANLDLSVDLLCTFDINVKPATPAGSPSQFFSDAGTVVFRSDWGKNAVYMLLLGEKGTVRQIGGVHEHPDAGSFVIYAYGELLALDAGYPGYPQHDKVNKAKNHSVILVDENGPDTDADLGEFFNTAALDFASVKMSYGGAKLTRNVLFVENQYFVVFDQIQSDTQHKYTYLVHGLAGPNVANTSFTKMPYGLIWKKPKASLEAFILTDRGTSAYEVGDDYHSLTFFSGSGDLPMHKLLRVRQTASALNSVMALVPVSADKKSPLITAVNITNGACIQISENENSQALCIVRGDQNAVQVKSSQSAIGDIETDGDMAFVKFLGKDNQPTLLFVKNATSIKIGQQPFLTAKQKCNLILSYNQKDGQIAGEFQGPENNSLSLKLPFHQPKVTGVAKQTFQPKTGIIQLDFEKTKSFLISAEK